MPFGEDNIACASAKYAVVKKNVKKKFISCVTLPKRKRGCKRRSEGAYELIDKECVLASGSTSATPSSVPSASPTIYFAT